jgi:nucleotide-binding universal stress UspA family protein
MHRYRHLLVGLTRQPSDGDLVRYAAMVARLGTAEEVHFVHILSDSGMPSASPHDQALKDIEATVQQHFTLVPSSAHVHFEVLKGPILDRMLEFAAEQETDLALVGHLRSHAGAQALARRLAMKAPCSIWMVPEGSPTTITRILVPIDFSDTSADCMRVAVSMARLAGNAECLPLHVFFNEATVTFEDYGAVLRGREREVYDHFMASVDTRGVPIRPLFEEGADVPHVIHRIADKQAADLIVMGTRGRSRSAAILLGSVTEAAITQTRIPLLVVKHFGARMNLVQALLDRRFRQKRGPRFD